MARTTCPTAVIIIFRIVKRKLICTPGEVLGEWEEDVRDVVRGCGDRRVEEGAEALWK
jgi:hypothetical protein